MLLLIALANVPIYLLGRQRSEASAHPLDGTTAEHVVHAIMITAVDLRVYPMFAILFGYGLVLSHRRQIAQGATSAAATRILYRRNLWLIAFGAAHAALLWGGDILGAYGLCGLLLVALLTRRSDLVAAVAAGLGIVALIALSATSIAAGAVAAGGDTANGSSGPTAMIATVSSESIIGAAIARLSLWPMQTLITQGPLGFTVPVAMLLGIVAGRRQLLENPQRHRKLLWTLALGGIGIGWAGGLVHALAHIGAIGDLDSVMWAFVWPHKLTGLACGVGYVAAFGLLGRHLSGNTPGLATSAVAAIGKRSLSGYLAQSALCAPLLAAWGLGLGRSLDSVTIALFAASVWLLTVAWAALLERKDAPGPAEELLRKLTTPRSEQQKRAANPSSAVDRR